MDIKRKRRFSTEESKETVPPKKRLRLLLKRNPKGQQPTNQKIPKLQKEVSDPVPALNSSTNLVKIIEPEQKTLREPTEPEIIIKEEEEDIDLNRIPRDFQKPSRDYQRPRSFNKQHHKPFNEHQERLFKPYHAPEFRPNINYINWLRNQLYKGTLTRRQMETLIRYFEQVLMDIQTQLPRTQNIQTHIHNHL